MRWEKRTSKKKKKALLLSLSLFSLLRPKRRRRRRRRGREDGRNERSPRDDDDDDDAFLPVSAVAVHHSLGGHRQRLRVRFQRVFAAVFVFDVVFDTVFDAEECHGTGVQNIYVRVYARFVFSPLGEHDRVYSNRRVRIGDEVRERDVCSVGVFVYNFVRDSSRLLSERYVVPFRNEWVHERMRSWVFGSYFQFSRFRYGVFEH
jgi:hypothetical protein